MHNGATSDVSWISTVHSEPSLEFSSSDIENITPGSELDIADAVDLALSSPDTHLPQIEDDTHAPGPAMILPATIRDEPNPESKAAKQKDALFYWEDVVLQVEGTLFRFPKSGLTGPYFDTLFNQIASNPATLEPGTSADNPIILDGVSKDDFQNFLRLIFPLRGIQPPSTDDQWLGVLHLATEWQFSDIRETAIAHLEHLFKSTSPPPLTKHDPIRALALCLKYNITQHTAHQFELIITSTTPLKRDGMFVAGLGADTLELIAKMREEWLCGELFGHREFPLSSLDVKGLMLAQCIVEHHLSKDRESIFGVQLEAEPEALIEQEEKAERPPDMMQSEMKGVEVLEELQDEMERLQQEVSEQERQQNELEMLEKERLQQRAEEERLAQRAEVERLAQRAEEEWLQQERLEHDRRQEEMLEQERLQQRAEEEGLKQKAEEERLAQRAKEEWLEEERLERRLEDEMLEKERIEKEMTEKEMIEKEILKQERIEQERLEKKRLKQEKEQQMKEDRQREEIKEMTREIKQLGRDFDQIVKDTNLVARELKKRKKRR